MAIKMRRMNAIDEWPIVKWPILDNTRHRAKIVRVTFNPEQRRISSHFTYGSCKSNEDTKTRKNLNSTQCEGIPEKYPLLGYTEFDHGNDTFLFCKFKVFIFTQPY